MRLDQLVGSARTCPIFFNLFLHVHWGEHSVEMGGHTCIPATVTISAVLAGG